ncbi:MAG: efflux RND transporter periplasmic adaptor subunit [Bacteroidales bacterium]
MNPRRASVALIAAIAIVAAFFLFRSRPTPPPAGSAPTASGPDRAISLTESARRDAGVKVEDAVSIVRTDQLDAPGVLALDEQRTARIGSLVEGSVVTTAADIGDRVRAGKVLAEMHSTKVHEAWAAYRKAIAEQRRLKTELAYSGAAADRAKRLFADKAISEQEVQRADANRVAAQEMLDMATTDVRRAEEDLEHLGITNSEDPTGESGEQIPVKAPIAGVVLERRVTPGTAVTPGTPLFVVSDLSRLWALVEVDETSLSRVKKGRPVTLRVAAYPDDLFQGTIDFVGDVINAKTRRVTVRCGVPNADGRLKPEMFITASLGESEPRPIVAVPSQAVHEIDQKTVVFVADASGAFRRREVSVGSDVNGMIEVRAGLKAGERVATTGSFLLKSELLKSTTPEG